MSKTANSKTILEIQQKIDRKDISDIRDRAISSLYMKLKTKLLSPEDLIRSKTKTCVGSLLNWINERKNEASPKTLWDSFAILSQIGRTGKGQTLLRKYGWKEFFLEYRKNVDNDLVDGIDKILEIVVRENQENEKRKSNLSHSSLNITTQSSTTSKASETPQKFLDTLNDRVIPTNTPSIYQTPIHEEEEKQPTPSSIHKAPSSPISTPAPAAKKGLTSTQCLQNRRSQRTYIELEKERWELPYIPLWNTDEDFITDMGVKLRYGDANSVNETARHLNTHVFKDFPPETFLQRTEVLNAVLEVGVATHDQAVFEDLVQVLDGFLERIKEMYRFLQNPYNRYMDTNGHDADRQEYLQLTYPTNEDARWREIKFNPDSLNSTNFDSHSLPYTLWDIAVKMLDWCLHEQKVGIALSMYRKVISIFTEIYTVEGSEEFSDIFIKILNGFDFVITSWALMNNPKPIPYILQEWIPALSLTNSIFKSKAPQKKAKILFSATMKLQQELRKALFSYHFPDENDVTPILDFFAFKAETLNKDEFIPKSYQKAKWASITFSQSQKFRLNLDTNASNGEEISSASEFVNIFTILEKILDWVELCLDFPFEGCLLDLVEYAELIEMGCGESKLEQVTQLFVEYLKSPLLEVKTRIVKKMIVRLQLREEMIKEKENKVKSKFLVKFLHRDTIIRLLTKDLLLASIPNDDGFPEENDFTNLVIQFLSMLLSCGDINNRRSLTKWMHSIQIASFCYNKNQSNNRDLKYIMETIEECCKYSPTKHLRILRGLFSHSKSHREVSTHILKKSWDLSSPSDLLAETFDIKSMASDAFIELNVYNSGITDYSFFNYPNLYQIYTSNKDPDMKKSSLEQLSILINDRSDTLGVTGRKLFRESKKDTDIFTYVIKDLLRICEENVDSLHPKEVWLVIQLLRFLVLSLLFYFDEPVVATIVKEVREVTDEQHDEQKRGWALVEVLNKWLGSKQVEVRKNSMRWLQVLLVGDHVKVWIDQGSGMPYFSVPTYMTNAYEFLFPTKMYRYGVLSKVELLTPEEKTFIQLEAAALEESKKTHWSVLPTYLQSQLINESDWSNSLLQLSKSTYLPYLTKHPLTKLKSLKPAFETLPSDYLSSKTLSTFYLHLKTLLKDLNLKLTNNDNNTDPPKPLTSFILVITSKLREINQPYTYLYTQLQDHGVENKQTHYNGTIKFNPYGQALCSVILHLVECVLETVQVCEKMSLPVDITDLVGVKGVVGWLIKLSVVLQDKGEVFRTLLLRVFKEVILKNGLKEAESFDRVREFLVDTVAARKMDTGFQGTYAIKAALQLLSELAGVYGVEVLKSKKQEVEEGLSEAGKERIRAYNSIGWLTRFVHHRDSRIRFLTWDLLRIVISVEIIKQHPTLVDESLAWFLNEDEVYAIKIAALNFLTKISEILLETEGFMEEQDEEENSNEVKMAYIIQSVNKQMFLTKLESILYQENVPALFVCSLIRFMKCLKADFKNCLPIFTTLDVWSVLSRYLKPSIVMKKYSKDTRAILYSGKNKKLESYNNMNLHEAFALDAISIIQLVLESVKKDPNLSSIIVRSVPFIENMLNCVSFIVQNKENLDQESSQSIIDTLFYSSSTLLHYLLSFSEEDTFKVLCGLFKRTSKIFFIESLFSNEDEEEKEVEEFDHIWPLLLKIMDNSEKIEVHYSVVRLISSLIQSFDGFANSDNSLDQKLPNNGEGMSYGVVMWYHFCMLFKRVYFPKKNERNDFSENFKNDVCWCLSILLLNCPEAKVTAIKENLIHKLTEKANDLCSAYRLSVIQNKNNKLGDKDSKFFEREWIRLLKILKNTFYKAGDCIDDELIPMNNTNSDNTVNECPQTIHKLLEIYESVSKNPECAIFSEISEVLWTLCAQSFSIKRWFSMNMVNKKTCGVSIILRTLKHLSLTSKSAEINYVFGLVSSLWTVTENVKKVIKDKTIEELIPKLLPKIKAEKDIMSCKKYICSFIKFLAAFTYTEEGIKAIMIHNKVFDFVLFCIENLTPPSPSETSTTTQIFINSLIFFGNASAFRKNKLHFLTNPQFLTNVMTILDSTEYPLKIRAHAAQTLYVCLHNHQGIKSVWSKQISEGVRKIIRDVEAYEITQDQEYWVEDRFGSTQEKGEFLTQQERYKADLLKILRNLEI